MGGHEYDSCKCALCLTVKRLVTLLYDPDASGAVQRRAVTRLREVHAELLDVAEGGEVGAATPAPPVGGQEASRRLPTEGEKSGGEIKPKQEETTASERDSPEVGAAKVVTNETEEEEQPVTEGEKSAPEEKVENESGGAKPDTPEKKRDRSKPSRKEKKTKEGDSERSRSRRRRRHRSRESRRPASDKRRRTTSRSRRRSKKDDRKTPSRSPLPRGREEARPSQASGLTTEEKRAVRGVPPKPPPVPLPSSNAERRAAPPPGYSREAREEPNRGYSWRSPQRPPPRVPREPDHPPPGYHDWGETEAQSKSGGYQPAPSKGKTKRERNANFRAWREYEEEHY